MSLHYLRAGDGGGSLGQSTLKDTVDDCVIRSCNDNRYSFSTTGFIGSVTAGPRSRSRGQVRPKLDREALSVIPTMATPSPTSPTAEIRSRRGPTAGVTLSTKMGRERRFCGPTSRPTSARVGPGTSPRRMPDGLLGILRAETPAWWRTGTDRPGAHDVCRRDGPRGRQRATPVAAPASVSWTACREENLVVELSGHAGVNAGGPKRPPAMPGY